MSKHLIQFRLSKERDEELDKISAALGFDKSKLLRMLVNRAVIQLKKDSLKAGGYDNLEINIKEVL